MPPKRKAATRNSSTEKTTKQVKKNDTKATKKTVEKEEEKIVKVVTKGGAAVDQYLPNKDSYKVFQKGATSYSTTLNKSDLQANNNKFYMIQIVQHEQNKQLFTFNRWGRVGVPGQQAIKGPFPEGTALHDYQKKLNDKTRGGYVALDIKYDDDEAPKKTVSKGKSKTKKASKLSSQVQGLMKLIFDMNMINNAMKEIGYDAKKMPLGKLGDNTVKDAFKVLNDLQQAIDKKKGNSVYSQLSGQFYTLIPHDFGFQQMSRFILDTSDKVTTKTEMLQSLTEMKLATKIIQAGEDDDTAEVDKNYKSLKNKIEFLPPSDKQHKQIVEFIDDSTSQWCKSKVKEIYTLNREGEDKKFLGKKIGNVQYLWHGSRLQNYGGILSQGLRIAPPEAPVNGYAYGKGVYFANAFATSTGYCYNNNTNEKLMLLCEVAVGKEGPMTHRANHGPCIDTKKHDTCLGFSSVYLKDQHYTKMNGIKMPSKSAKAGQNAYIIYNVDQASIKYLVRFE